MKKVEKEFVKDLKIIPLGALPWRFMFAIKRNIILGMKLDASIFLSNQKM
jgi:hypothetical protein